MKKFSLLLAVAVLSMSLASCGGDEGTTTDTSAATGDTTAAEEVTTAAPETTEEVTTAEPEPEYEEVFTPSYIDNFDDPDNTNWKANAQMTDFAVADGYLTTTSTGGDPSIANKNDFDLNCDEIDVIVVKFLNGTPSDATQIFFTTDTTTGFCEEASYKDVLWNTDIDCSDPAAAAEDDWDTMYYYVGDNDLWTGTLKDVRIDLSNGEGQFVVDYIAFGTVEMVEVTAE
ncbi:MAG: hypothetical protein IJ449_08690 [Clostridia bacterium]|nr:hypothetical protein [Clostridia bacterium]